MRRYYIDTSTENNVLGLIWDGLWWWADLQRAYTRTRSHSTKCSLVLCHPSSVSVFIFSPLATNVIKIKLLIINVHRLVYLTIIYLFVCFNIVHSCVWEWRSKHGVWTFNALKSMNSTRAPEVTVCIVLFRNEFTIDYIKGAICKILVDNFNLINSNWNTRFDVVFMYCAVEVSNTVSVLSS